LGQRRLRGQDCQDKKKKLFLHNSRQTEFFNLLGFVTFFRSLVAADRSRLAADQRLPGTAD
jgi:hypothetical protein